MRRGKPDPNTALVSARVTVALKQAVEKAAEEKGVSVSVFIRESLENAVSSSDDS